MCARVFLLHFSSISKIRENILHPIGISFAFIDQQNTVINSFTETKAIENFENRQLIKSFHVKMLIFN